MIEKYQIGDLALIKVDIEGGEENIMVDVLSYSLAHNVPVYLSFHYSWWANKDISRFTAMFTKFKCGDCSERVVADPFISILFEPIL